MRINQWLLVLLLLLPLCGSVPSLPPHSHQAPSAATSRATVRRLAELTVEDWKWQSGISKELSFQALTFSLYQTLFLSLFDHSESLKINSGFIKEQVEQNHIFTVCSYVGFIYNENLGFVDDLTLRETC